MLFVAVVPELLLFSTVLSTCGLAFTSIWGAILLGYSAILIVVGLAGGTERMTLETYDLMSTLTLRRSVSALSVQGVIEAIDVRGGRICVVDVDRVEQQPQPGSDEDAFHRL